MQPDDPIRQLFDRHRDNVLAKHGSNIRPIVIESIEKMLWCSTSVYGSKLYICENTQCSWQHITFTLPEQFWPLFAANRQLLKSLSKLASKTVLRWAKKKK